MPTRTLQFWYEFASTYSYLSVMRVEHVAIAAGVALEWKPFLLGPIFSRQGWNDSPFNIYAAKGRYMWRDLERLCAAYDIPFRRPSRFPQNGLLAARVACLGVTPGWCPEFTRRVFTAHFAGDADISAAGTIGAILDGMDLAGGEICARAAAQENKDFLRRQTEEAQRLGIFGAPSFIAGGELFWGNDRLENAIAWLDGTADR